VSSLRAAAENSGKAAKEGTVWVAFVRQLNATPRGYELTTAMQRLCISESQQRSSAASTYDADW